MGNEVYDATYDLDTYEVQRLKKPLRSRDDLIVDETERFGLLVEAGYSPNQLRRTISDTEIMKLQRSRSAKIRPLEERFILIKERLKSWAIKKPKSNEKISGIDMLSQSDLSTSSHTTSSIQDRTLKSCFKNK